MNTMLASGGSEMNPCPEKEPNRPSTGEIRTASFRSKQQRSTITKISIIKYYYYNELLDTV